MKGRPWTAHKAGYECHTKVRSFKIEISYVEQQQEPIRGGSFSTLNPKVMLSREKTQI